MALHYAGIACELREVSLNDKPAALLAISPKGTVPVLQLPDGRVLDESLDIMRWALSEHDPDGWLNPDMAERVFELIDQYDHAFKFHLDRYKYPQRFGFDVGAAVHFTQAVAMLKDLNAQLTNSPFVFGATASLADIALFPFIRQFAAVNRSAFDALDLPSLQAWLSSWLNHPRFIAIMVKHRPWKSQDDLRQMDDGS